MVGLIAPVGLGIASFVGATAGGHSLVRAMGVPEAEGKVGCDAFFFVGVPLVSREQSLR